MAGRFHQSPDRSRRLRPGFTMMELLVAVGLIAFMAAILLTVVRGVVGNARVAATKATIRKIDTILTQRMEGFSRYIQDQDTIARNSGRRPVYVNPAYVTQQQGNMEQAKVLGRKDTFRRNFPQRFSEMDSPPSYDSSKHTSETESAELLFHFLMKMPGFGTDAPNSDQFSSSEIADTDGDGLMEFVDGWGQPLRFYRWPTRLFRPGGVVSGTTVTEAQSVTTAADHEDWEYLHPIVNDFGVAGIAANVLIATLPNASGMTRGSGATFGNEHNDPLAKDPDDPMGRLHLHDSSAAPSQATNFENSFHTGDTYHTPLIVSGGIDGILGLYEPNDTSNFGYLAQPDLGALESILDNITNRNLQASGGGQ